MYMEEDFVNINDSDIDIIKSKRELDKILRFLKNINYTYKTELENKIIKENVIVIFNIIKHLDNIYLVQHSSFGFEIEYSLYKKNKFIFNFHEKHLPKKYDRHIMDKLIMGKRNKNIYKKYNNGKIPRTLSDIDY